MEGVALTSEMSGYQPTPDECSLHVPRCARHVLCVLGMLAWQHQGACSMCGTVGTCSRSALIQAGLGTLPASWTPPPGGGHYEGECGQGPGAGPEAIGTG